MSIVGSSRESSHRGFGAARERAKIRAKAHLVLRVVAPEGVVLSTVLRSSFRGNRAQMGGRHSAYIRSRAVRSTHDNRRLDQKAQPDLEPHRARGTRHRVPPQRHRNQKARARPHGSSNFIKGRSIIRVALMDGNRERGSTYNTGYMLPFLRSRWPECTFTVIAAC